MNKEIKQSSGGGGGYPYYHQDIQKTKEVAYQKGFIDGSEATGNQAEEIWTERIAKAEARNFQAGVRQGKKEAQIEEAIHWQKETKKALEEQKQDLTSVINMLEGDTERVKIINYIKKYLLK
jgi:hypothetical protein